VAVQQHVGAEGGRRRHREAEQQQVAGGHPELLDDADVPVGEPVQRVLVAEGHDDPEHRQHQHPDPGPAQPPRPGPHAQPGQGERDQPDERLVLADEHAPVVGQQRVEGQPPGQRVLLGEAR
jgi:hypothetical protein